MTFTPDCEPLAFSCWWGCLRENERNLLVDLNTAYAIEPTFILADVLYTLATFEGIDPASEFFNAFIGVYPMSLHTVVIEGVDTDVFTYDGLFWPALSLFSETDDFSSPPYCKLLHFTDV